LVRSGNTSSSTRASTERDVWGAIVIGFVSQYGGTKLLNKLIDEKDASNNGKDEPERRSANDRELQRRSQEQEAARPPL
jgi:hypothetical protein